MAADLLCSSLSMLKPMAYVWRPNSFFTAAIVKTQRKFVLLGGKILTTFRQEVLNWAILNKHMIHLSSLPQLNKLSFCASS
jgi:hypothetical protein